MVAKIAQGLLIPLLGTSLGAACVLFMKNQLKESVQKALSGFAAGVMIAAAIWSLIIPAIDQSESMGKLAFVPAFVGIWCGIAFLLLMDTLTPHLHIKTNEKEGPTTKLNRTSMMLLAVTIHNIPEGMAVGVVFAGWLSGKVEIAFLSALALSIGIAIQNFPEGAIVSMPLCAEGVSKKKAFWLGTMTGVVEPVAALITISLANVLVPTLPYLQGFAAGAMLYVVVEELIPETTGGTHTNIGTVMFALGFTVMMMLEVALG